MIHFCPPHNEYHALRDLFFPSSQNDALSVSNSAHHLYHQKCEQICTHGANANTIWYIQKGWVKLVRQTPDGKETLITLCTNGDIFGEMALFPNAHYTYTAEILVDNTEILSLSALSLRQIIQQNSQLSMSLMALFHERTAQAEIKLDQLNTMSASQRLGCLLLRLHHMQREHPSETLYLPIEKHILASYLGMKPETLSRTQHQLEKIGVHIIGQKINIENINKLRHFVCNSCSDSGNCKVEDAVIKS